MATSDSSTITESAPYSAKHQALSDSLDDDIASVRASIQALSKQRSLLSASLLGSTRVQEQLNGTSTNALSTETLSLLSASQSHAQENSYRLALGVTAFPFQDPSPANANQRLLGVRFDITDSQGKYDTPYYILAQRVVESSSTDDLRVYRHTIPSFIPLRQYEELYLPLPQDEGYGSGENNSNASRIQQRQTQDLHGLVKHVRHDLVSWKLRCEAIEHLQRELRLVAPMSDDMGDGQGQVVEEGKFGIRSLNALAVDALQAKIEWTSGAVGRIKISAKGIVEKAVLYDHSGRMKEAERILTRDRCSASDLLDRLAAVYELIQREDDGGEDEEEDPDDDEDESMEQEQSEESDAERVS